MSHLYAIPYGFYEPPNEQNWMCELCMFSQIRSHIQCNMVVHTYVHVAYLCTNKKTIDLLVGNCDILEYINLCYNFM